jgi:hypothetical protein
MSASVYFWRRTDVEGLERLELAMEPDGVRATSTVICLEAGGLRLDHSWKLDADWRAQFVTIERWNAQGHGVLRLERVGTGWRVDGEPRPDLEGADEPDLSVTPFCNTFPIRRTPEGAGASVTLDTAFIDGPALTVARSTQRYDRQGPGWLRRPWPLARLRSGPGGGRPWLGAALREPFRAVTDTFLTKATFIDIASAVMPTEMDAKAALPA